MAIDYEGIKKSILSQDEIAVNELTNGLKVLIKEDHSTPVVSVQLWVKTGSIHEEEYLGSGISHYVEHMLFKGTEKRSYLDINNEIEVSGGTVNAYTTFDRTVYYIDGLSENTYKYLDVLGDIAFNSAFDLQEVEKEQSVILREIDMGLDDPDYLLSRAVFETAFRKHHYRFPVIGERDLFTQITREHLYDYYKKRYVPNNMVLVLAGDVSENEVLESIEKTFGFAKMSILEPVIIPSENSQLSQRKKYIYGNYNCVRGCVSYEIPGLTHRDTPALDVLANALGQGISSVLWQSLREEKKCVHRIGASSWNPGESGLFWIHYLCDSGKKHEVEEAIKEEIERTLKVGLSDKYVNKALRQVIVSEVNKRKTMSQQASRIGSFEVVIGDLNYAKTYIGRLESLRADDLKEVLGKYLINHKSTFAAIEPESDKVALNIKSKNLDKLGDFEQITLKNGARILLQENKKLPKIHLSTALLGGPLQENINEAGITGVLATLLTKDTEKRTAFEIADTIESLGGGFYEFSGNNSFGLKMEVMSSDIEIASSILEQAFLYPKFNEKQFEIEREAQISAIKEELDEITYYSIKSMREHFFGDHPYKHGALGNIPSLEKLDLEAIKKHHNRLVNGNNFVMAISGDFDKKGILELISPWVEKMPNEYFQNHKELIFDGPRPAKYEEYLDKEQVVVLQAYPGLSVIDEKFEVSEVLDGILSGMSSQLFINIREKLGMAYYVGSSCMAGLNTGMFYLYVGTNTENYKKVIDVLNEEIERIKRGEIETEELERVKTHLKSMNRLSLQALGSLGNRVVLDALYDLPINRWKDFDNRIDVVDKDAIVDFVNENFQESLKVQFVAGPLR